jgi:predicted DNA-binding transcriptional regulator AlpA
MITTKTILRVVDIARERGLSTSQLYQHPWLLPAFGQPSDFEEPPLRWRRSTVDAWFARPLAERRAEWEAANPKRRAMKRNKVRT